MKNLGKVIRCYRAINFINQRDLAEVIGVTAPTIMRVEKGQEISGKTLMKILMWLNK